MNCPWGENGLSGYLGSNRESWRRYDACTLLEDGARVRNYLSIKVPRTNSWKPNSNLSFWNVPALELVFH